MSDIPYTLPENLYFICGRRACKWLPPNYEGICYIGELIPSTIVMEHKDLIDILTQNIRHIRNALFVLQ